MTTETKKNTKFFWFMFVASLAFMAFLLLFAPQWFWLSLPGTLTGLAGGMDWI